MIMRQGKKVEFDTSLNIRKNHASGYKIIVHKNMEEDNDSNIINFKTSLNSTDCID